MTTASSNKGKRETIRQAAFKLFLQTGYAKASYTEIARESKCNRALVQYYFPKKENLLGDFAMRIVELSNEYFSQVGKLETGKNFIDFYVTGTLHFDLLANNEQLRPLSTELMSSRAITHAIIQSIFPWIVGAPELNEISEDTARSAFILAMGGAYELVYEALTAEKRLDAAAVSQLTVTTFINAVGLSDRTFASSIAAHMLLQDSIEKASAFVLDHLTSTSNE